MTSPALQPVPRPDRELTPAGRASRAAADAARRINRALVATHAPPEALDAAARELTAIAERLEGHAGASRYDGTAGLDGPLGEAILERHPFLGVANPGAPPLRIDEGTGDVTAVVTLDARHEGMPTRAHGGWMAALFDQVVGIAAARVAGRPAMTGTLTIRYVAPTPVGVPLRLHAAARRTGARTLRATATMGPDQGSVTAEADAVLVLGTPDPAAP